MLFHGNIFGLKNENCLLSQDKWTWRERFLSWRASFYEISVPKLFSVLAAKRLALQSATPWKRDKMGKNLRLRSLSFPLWSSPTQVHVALFGFFFFFLKNSTWKGLRNQLSDFWVELSLLSQRSFYILTSDPYWSSMCIPCMGSASLSVKWICRAFAAGQASSLAGQFLTRGFQAHLGSEAAGPASRAGCPFFTILVLLRRAAPYLRG